MALFFAKDINELQIVAAQLIPYIGKSTLIAFYGKMGAGKTTLIKAICKELHVKNTVTSPTFALVNEYRTGKDTLIYHFDFYRINKIEELYDMGYDEYFYSGNYCFIEWPELAESLLLPDTLKITIEADDMLGRKIEVIEHI